MIKPFCVKSEDLTNGELKEMLEKCVQLGAAPCHWNQEKSNDEYVYLYGKDDFAYWGVAVDLCTTTSDRGEGYDKNLLTKEQAFEMLGLTNQKTILKPSWDSAPEWANYLAMDKDGVWFWFENKPVKRFGDRWVEDAGKIEHVPFPDDVWEGSLEQKPTKGN